jgi:hypothetical protein
MNFGHPLSSTNSPPQAFIAAVDLVDDDYNPIINSEEPINASFNAINFSFDNLVDLHLKSEAPTLRFLQKEAISRHGFRISMTIAGASLALLAIPVVGCILYPVVAGIALLSAATFFAYRQLVIAPKLINLHEISDDKARNEELDGYVIPTINWKEDLKEGLRCFIVIGAIQLYAQPFYERYLERNNMIVIKL